MLDHKSSPAWEVSSSEDRVVASNLFHVFTACFVFHQSEISGVKRLNLGGYYVNRVSTEPEGLRGLRNEGALSAAWPSGKRCHFHGDQDRKVGGSTRTIVML